MLELLCAALVPLSAWLVARHLRRAASGVSCAGCASRDNCGQNRRGKACEQERDGV